MTYARSIEDFKARLSGGGARPTMFQVEMTFPGDVVEDARQVTEDGIFLIKASQLPGSNIGEAQVPFRGRILKVSGDRSFEDWNITVINDVSFRLRMAFEEWSEKIQNFNFTTGANSLDQYFASAIVRQFDRDGTQLRAYRFDGIWPKVVAPIQLDFDSRDSVEEYEVQFAVQYFSSIDAGDPRTSGQRDPQATLRGITS